MKSIDILMTIGWIKQAWEDLTSSVITNCLSVVEFIRFRMMTVKICLTVLNPMLTVVKLLIHGTTMQKYALPAVWGNFLWSCCETCRHPCSVFFFFRGGLGIPLFASWYSRHFPFPFETGGRPPLPPQRVCSGGTDQASMRNMPQVPTCPCPVSRGDHLHPDLDVIFKPG